MKGKFAIFDDSRFITYFYEGMSLVDWGWWIVLVTSIKRIGSDRMGTPLLWVMQVRIERQFNNNMH